MTEAQVNKEKVSQQKIVDANLDIKMQLNYKHMIEEQDRKREENKKELLGRAEKNNEDFVKNVVDKQNAKKNAFDQR